MWCVNYSAIFSQNCWVAALCQSMCNSQCVQVFQLPLTIEVNSKITTSSLFAYCWLGRKNKPGNLVQCKTEKYFQGIRIIIMFITISPLFGLNYTCPTRQIAFCSTLFITYTSDFVTPVSCVPDAKKFSRTQNNWQLPSFGRQQHGNILQRQALRYWR